MIVDIKVCPQNKSTLKTFFNNVPKLCENLTGDFNCNIEIKAKFK